MVPERSYLICATPRSGTGLLAGLLGSTGVAGCPYEHFWPVDDGPLSDIVRDATARNGVFGATVMWGYFENGALGLELTALLPDLRFIRLRREDTVAQAVSHLRAIQTNVWYAGDVRRPGGEPRFDAAALDHLVAELELHNHAWDAWLDGQGATPLQLTYETLLADPEAATQTVLEHLGLPSDVPIAVQTERQADELSADWIARYRALRR